MPSANPQRQAIAAPYRRARLDAYVAEHVARLHQRDMFFRQGHVQARHAAKTSAGALEGEQHIAVLAHHKGDLSVVRPDFPFCPPPAERLFRPAGHGLEALFLAAKQRRAQGDFPVRRALRGIDAPLCIHQMEGLFRGRFSWEKDQTFRPGIARLMQIFRERNRLHSLPPCICNVLGTPGFCNLYATSIPQYGKTDCQWICKGRWPPTQSGAVFRVCGALRALLGLFDRLTAHPAGRARFQSRRDYFPKYSSTCS